MSLQMETPAMRESNAFSKKKPSLANFWDSDDEEEKDGPKGNQAVGTPTKKPIVDNIGEGNNGELPASLEQSRSALKKGFPTKSITILNNEPDPESPKKSKMGFIQDSSESYVKNGLVDNLGKKRINQDIEEEDIFSSEDSDDDEDDGERREEEAGNKSLPSMTTKPKSFPTQPQLSMFVSATQSQQTPSSPLKLSTKEQENSLKMDKLSRVTAPEPKHHSITEIPTISANSNSQIFNNYPESKNPQRSSSPKAIPTSAELKKSFASMPTNQDASDAQFSASQKIKTKAVLDMTDMRTFLTTPIPQEYGMFECFVTRERSSLGGLFFPKYYMWFEKKGLFLMGARKRKKNKSSNYLISLSKTDLSRKSKNFVAKVRSNLLGTQFQMFDEGDNPKKLKSKTARPRNQLGCVFYEPNPFGYKGPRKLLAVLPDADGGKTIPFPQENTKHTMVTMFKNGEWTNLRQFQNKSPTWNESLMILLLKF